MKFSKVITFMCLTIGMLKSQTGFGIEVGNYWVVKNNLAYGGYGVSVEYSLRDWQTYLIGELSPGLTDGTTPPFIYSSFPADIRDCDRQSAKTNVLSVYTPISKTPICEFQVIAKVGGKYGPKLCDGPTIIEPKSLMRGVMCSHTQQVEGSYNNTVRSEISMDCVDWNKCLSIKE
jgi:hypothetical protein